MIISIFIFFTIHFEATNSTARWAVYRTAITINKWINVTEYLINQYHQNRQLLFAKLGVV